MRTGKRNARSNMRRRAKLLAKYAARVGIPDPVKTHESAIRVLFPAASKLSKAKRRKEELEKRIKQQKAHIKRLQTAIKKNTRKAKRVMQQLPELEQKAKDEAFLEGMQKL